VGIGVRVRESSTVSAVRRLSLVERGGWRRVLSVGFLIRQFIRSLTIWKKHNEKYWRCVSCVRGDSDIRAGHGIRRGYGL
jgi:hypothetical protein